MPVAEKKLTWDDIKDWPEDVSRRVELFDGALEVSALPWTDHGLAASQLAGLLFLYLTDRRSGRLFVAPIDVVLAPDCVCEPDLCFVRAERLEIIKATHIAGPPDLCIEIISQSSRRRDEVTKYARYARYGVAEYWLVDLQRRGIRTFQQKERGYQLLADAREGDLVVSAVFPELRLDPAEVFPSV
jgi:Uma2 family endonuclease